jgi:hypothetical protein
MTGAKEGSEHGIELSGLQHDLAISITPSVFTQKVCNTKIMVIFVFYLLIQFHDTYVCYIKFRGEATRVLAVGDDELAWDMAKLSEAAAGCNTRGELSRLANSGFPRTVQALLGEREDAPSNCEAAQAGEPRNVAIKWMWA